MGANQKTEIPASIASKVSQLSGAQYKESNDLRIVHAVWEQAHSVDPRARACFVCQLRDMWDRQLTRHWLNTTHRVGTHQLLAVTCCPTHAWRLYEVTQSLSPHYVPEAPNKVGITSMGWTSALHGQVSGLFTRAAEVVAKEFGTAERRVHLANTRQELSWLLERRPAGLLGQTPPCALCPQMAGAESLLFELLGSVCDSWGLQERTAVADWLCPRDQRIGSAYLSRFSEFALTPHKNAVDPVAFWWNIPRANGEDKAFVERLLETDAANWARPDHVCPACWVRAEQEIDLLDLICHQSSADRLSGTADPAPGDETASAMAHDLCPRHTTLLRRRLSSSIMISPVQHLWESGELCLLPGAESCPACGYLKGWDLARMEGLRRAAGTVLGREATAERLRQVLEHRGDWFCLPHWQRATASAPLYVTATLLAGHLQHVRNLVRRMQQHQLELRSANAAGQSSERVDVENQETQASVPIEACWKTALTLGGYAH
jgi:hypothetical protein